VKDLQQGNLTPAELDRALKSDSEDALSALAGGDEKLLEQLNELKDLYDQREAKKALYYEADAAWNAVPKDERDENKALYDRLLLAEDFYFDVVDKFNAKQAEILEANSFNPAEFEFLRLIPAKKLSKEARAAGETTPREDRLALLKESYPGRAEQLQKAYDALVEAFRRDLEKDGAYAAAKARAASAEEALPAAKAERVELFRKSSAAKVKWDLAQREADSTAREGRALEQERAAKTAQRRNLQRAYKNTR